MTTKLIHQQARLSRREKEINADIDREKLEKKQRVQQHSPMVDGVKNKKSAFERPAQEPTRPPARPPPKSKRTVPLPHRPVPEPEPEPVPEPEPEPEPVPEPEPEPEPEPDHVYKMEEFEQKEPEQSLYDDVQTEGEEGRKVRREGKYGRNVGREGEKRREGNVGSKLGRKEGR